MCKKLDERSCAEKWEIHIIVLCIILLLFGVGTYVVKQWWLTPEPQIIEVVTTPQDGVDTNCYYDKSSLDSLIAIVNNHFVENEKKYAQLSNVREDERFKSLASMLIGIISAIALFFGYKSFRDIREKGEEMSKEVAEKAAKGVAEQSAENYLNSQLPGIVKQELDKGIYKKEVMSAIKDSIITQLKPELLIELKKNTQEPVESDSQKEQKEGALSPDEMFNSANQGLSSPAQQATNTASKEETVVESQKKESDGQD